MIVSLLMTIEGSQPEISRLINVDDSMDLGALSHLIDAAFGFSGGRPHIYVTETSGTREIISSSPSADEYDESNVSVSAINPMTYVYNTSADWNIHVDILGTSRLEGPTPMLIDASGPDVVEACNGPSLMTRFHVEARRLAAGLEPDMEVAPLVLSFLPVMSPERLLQRLTHADPVTVAERISYVAEDLMIDSASSMADDPRASQFADDFEEFLDSRPDLQEILALDPNPEHNPALLSAMAGFFEDRLGESEYDYDYSFPELDPYPDSFRDTIVMVLRCFTIPVKLTGSGYLPSSAVKEVGTALGIETSPNRPRETSSPDILATRSLLTSANLLVNRYGQIGLTEVGYALIDDRVHIDELDEHFNGAFEELFGADEWRTIVRWLATENRIIDHAGPQSVPSDMPGTYGLLTTLGVLEGIGSSAGCTITHGGELFIGRMLALKDKKD